jgi:hypothetical protein
VKVKMHHSINVVAVICCVCVGTSAAHADSMNPTNDELVALLLEDFGTHDEACRGGSGDKNETWVACGSRDYAASLLNEFGWCHGENGQSAYEMVWHQCSSNSLLPSGQ